MSGSGSHIHSFYCLGNTGTSILNASGQWEGNNASATGQMQAVQYSYDSNGTWVSPCGTYLGTMQAEPMGFVLTPMKYEVIHIPTVSARFEIRVNCDWCGILQTIVQDVNNYDSSGLLLNIDKVRQQFVGAVYNASGAQQNNASGSFDNPGSVSTQWKHFIETILHYTAWAAVENNATTSRSVDINKVKNDLVFVHNINVCGTPDDPIPYHTLEGNMGNSHRCILGFYQDSTVNTQKYDRECIGQLINNTNMQQIMHQLRNFGAFGGNLNVPEINPVIGIINNGTTTSTYRLFKRGDSLAFPINIKSIIGHTASTLDESFLGGYSMVNDTNITYDIELRILFQQTIDTDSTIEPTNILDEWRYHDTLRWHESTRTFQTIRYDQNNNQIIVTPAYDENGNRIDDVITS